MRNILAGICLVFLFSFILLTGCHSAKKIGGPFYYNRCSLQGDIEPSDEMTLEQARKMDSYYEVYFNDQGLVSKLGFFDHGKITYSVAYEYRPDGKLQRGDFQHFDSNGKLITKNGAMGISPRKAPAGRAEKTAKP